MQTKPPETNKESANPSPFILPPTIDKPKKWYKRWWFLTSSGVVVVGLIAGLIAGWSISSQEGGIDSGEKLNQDDVSLPPDNNPQLDTKNKITDTGDFKFVLDDTDKPDLQLIQKIVAGLKIKDLIDKDFNAQFALPVDVPVIFAECGMSNAFFDPEKKQVVMCYEFMAEFATIFAANNISGDKLIKSITGTTLFFLFHEMGHAFVDLYKLPTTGKEEDAVDQLATALLVEGGTFGSDAILDAATTFYAWGETTKIEEFHLSDEHSLDKQRFYNIICWIYGSNPQNYYALVQNNFLPAERATLCESEFGKLYNSWINLLQPYTKTGLRAIN